MLNRLASSPFSCFSLLPAFSPLAAIAPSSLPKPHLMFWVSFKNIHGLKSEMFRHRFSSTSLSFLFVISSFLDAQASLAPTHVCLSVRWSVRPLVRPSHFRISNLSASLVALREKLKKVDPNYLSILGLGRISWNWSGGVGGRSIFFGKQNSS